MKRRNKTSILTMTISPMFFATRMRATSVSQIIKRFVSLCTIILLLMLPGCQMEPSRLADGTTDAIGTTFGELQRQHPSYGFLHLDGYDFTAECLGDTEAGFGYLFFGTRDRLFGKNGELTLEEVASQYGSELQCAGICTTVGKAFSLSEDAESVETFFSSLGIDSNDPERVWNWNNFILFDYQGYTMVIEDLDMVPLTKKKPEGSIRTSFPLYVIQDQTLAANHALCQDWVDQNASLSDSHLQEEKATLIVHGQTVSQDIVLKHDDDGLYSAELPVVAILKALGARFRWKNDHTAIVYLDSKVFYLDTVACFLNEKDGLNVNLLTMLVFGGPYRFACHAGGDNDVMVDNATIIVLLQDLNQKIYIDNSNTITIEDRTED